MHWSYKEIPSDDLCQGDILLPTDRLRAVLAIVHPWFNDAKYIGFMVISQTCDLVRRDGEHCKTPYVEIAVIRPLRPYLVSLFGQCCRRIDGRYFPKGELGKANDLLDRVINQNEAALGLFYLHPEAAIGIAEESIALLRVSITLRSEEHYLTLLDSRRGQLDPEFANKLGWLRGNLYSRIGIKDWSETEADRKTAGQIKKRLLEDTTDSSPRFLECPNAFLEAIRNGSIDIGAASLEEIEAKIAQFTGKSYKDKAFEVLERVLDEQGIDAGRRRKVQNTLRNDPIFMGAFKLGKN